MSSLPSSLRRQINGLREKLRWVEGSKAIFAASGLLFVSWLIVLGSDYFWNTPHPLLVFFSVTGWISAAWVLRLGYRWAVKQPQYDENLAKIAQKRFPAIGDRLLGVIELCDPNKETSKHSAALREAAVAQVTEETARQDLGKAVDLRILKRVTVGFMSVVIVASICAFFITPASLNALKRWANPFDPVERYTFTEIITPANNAHKHVARSEPFQILSTINPDLVSRPSRPEEATLISEDGDSATAALNGTSYLFELKGVTKPTSYTLTVGDDESRFQVTPHDPPSLEVFYKIQYPDYLGYEPIVDEEEMKKPAPFGTSVTIEAIASERLQIAKTIAKDAGQEELFATIDGKKLTLALGSVEGERNLQLIWRDVFGITCRRPLKLEVTTKKDEEPHLVELKRINHDSELPPQLVLEGTNIEIEARAADDYGIRELSLSWVVRNLGTEEKETWLAPWQPVERNTTIVERSQKLNPTELGAHAGATLVIRAHATDWKKGAEAVVAPELLLEVISMERHAEILQAEMAKLQGLIAEITRQQEEILMETLKLDASDVDKLSDKAIERKTEALAEKQKDLANQLSKLSEKVGNLIEEAKENSDLNGSETLNEMKETMEAMEQLADGKMQNPSEQSPSEQSPSEQSPSEQSPSEQSPSEQSPSMQEASQQLSQSASSPSESERKENLTEAEDSQREIIEQLQELTGEINEQLDELEALTLALRLRKIKNTEDDLRQSLKENLSNTIGLRAKDLPDKQKLLNDNLNDRQLETHAEATVLKNEISRYHERTNKPKYGQVSKEMEEAQAAEGLLDVAGLIGRNISLSATDGLVHWSTKFEEWADLLEPEESEGGGGGSGECQGQDITKQLLALLRIRKEEADLRRNTEALEKKKKEVGSTQVEEGDVKQALTALNPAQEGVHSLENDDQEDAERFNKAVTLAKKGESKQALAEAQKIKDDHGKASALSAIASAQVDTGDVKQALATLKQAEEVARKFEHEDKATSAGIKQALQVVQQLEREKQLLTRSDELGARQRELMMDLTDVQIELAQDPLNPLFDDAHTSMADASDRLKKQDSGNVTVASETKAWELVSDIVNLLVEELAQQSSSSGQSQGSTSASIMQSLLQQLGQSEGQGEGQGEGMGSFGGGSRQGGDTDSNPALKKTNDGWKKIDDRRSRKASGWKGGVPKEFQEALEHYFDEIEE